MSEKILVCTLDNSEIIKFSGIQLVSKKIKNHVATFKNCESGDSCSYSILTISRHLSNSDNLALNSDACNLDRLILIFREF